MKKFQWNTLSNLLDEVVEERCRIYEKFVPEQTILDFTFKRIQEIDFPDVEIFLFSDPGSLPIQSALQNNKSEYGIILSHKSEVFETIKIWFRAKNFGKTTYIGQYKISNYRPVRKITYPVEIKQCCGTRIENREKLEGKWINTTKHEIIQGKLINRAFWDNKIQLYGAGSTLARKELFEAFNFFTDNIIFPAMIEFVESY